MAAHKLQKWTTRTSEYLVKDRWIRLRADDCVTPSGHTIAPYYVLEYDDWIACMILSDDGEVTMLNHYRHAADEYVLEVVAGVTEEGESPDDTARRELEEETGLINTDLHKIGVCYANPATHTNKIHCYLALGGTFDGNRYDEPGADFEIVRMPLRELQAKIADGSTIFQGYHLAAIFLALQYLQARGSLPGKL